MERNMHSNHHNNKKIHVLIDEDLSSSFSNKPAVKPTSFEFESFFGNRYGTPHPKANTPKEHLMGSPPSIRLLNDSVATLLLSPSISSFEARLLNDSIGTFSVSRDESFMGINFTPRVFSPERLSPVIATMLSPLSPPQALLDFSTEEQFPLTDNMGNHLEWPAAMRVLDAWLEPETLAFKDLFETMEWSLHGTEHWVSPISQTKRPFSLGLTVDDGGDDDDKPNELGCVEVAGLRPSFLSPLAHDPFRPTSLVAEDSAHSAIFSIGGGILDGSGPHSPGTDSLGTHNLSREDWGTLVSWSTAAFADHMACDPRDKAWEDDAELVAVLLDLSIAPTTPGSETTNVLDSPIFPPLERKPATESLEIGKENENHQPLSVVTTKSKLTKKSKGSANKRGVLQCI